MKSEPVIELLIGHLSEAGMNVPLDADATDQISDAQPLPAAKSELSAFSSAFGGFQMRLRAGNSRSFENFDLHVLSVAQFGEKWLWTFGLHRKSYSACNNM
jgi:hypothetical protein